MSRGTDEVRPDEARTALASIAAMKRAAAKRGIGPRWVSLTIALLSGGLFAAQALTEDRSTVVLFLILGIALVGIYGRGAVGAAPRASSIGRGVARKAAGIIGVSVVLLSLFLAAIVLRDRFDVAWAPVAVGAVVAVLVFLLDDSERRSYVATYDAEEGV